jgi:hypothetical protein
LGKERARREEEKGGEAREREDGQRGKKKTITHMPSGSMRSNEVHSFPGIIFGPFPDNNKFSFSHFVVASKFLLKKSVNVFHRPLPPSHNLPLPPPSLSLSLLR